MITFDPKRTIESNIAGDKKDFLNSIIVVPKGTCAFRIVDVPTDPSCTFFAITLTFKIQTEHSIYYCQTQSVTDILRDATKKPLVFSLLHSKMKTEIKEMENMLDEDLKKNEILLAGKIKIELSPEEMERQLKIEFQKYQP